VNLLTDVEKLVIITSLLRYVATSIHQRPFEADSIIYMPVRTSRPLPW